MTGLEPAAAPNAQSAQFPLDKPRPLTYIGAEVPRILGQAREIALAPLHTEEFARGGPEIASHARVLPTLHGGSLRTGVNPLPHTTSSLKAARQPKLLGPVRATICTNHYSRSTKKAYVHWIRWFSRANDGWEGLSTGHQSGRRDDWSNGAGRRRKRINPAGRF